MNENKRPESMQRITTPALAEAFIAQQLEALRKQIGGNKGPKVSKKMRRLMQQKTLAKYRPSEYLPGPTVGDDDASLAKAAGDIGTTIFHPVGTAKMGTANDPMAVVDERLRFYGLGGLRIVDASIMPTITSGNTTTPTAMIAEKGAKMILEDAK